MRDLWSSMTVITAMVKRVTKWWITPCSPHNNNPASHHHVSQHSSSVPLSPAPTSNTSTSDEHPLMPHRLLSFHSHPLAFPSTSGLTLSPAVLLVTITEEDIGTEFNHLFPCEVAGSCGLLVFQHIFNLGLTMVAVPALWKTPYLVPVSKNKHPGKCVCIVLCSLLACRGCCFPFLFISPSCGPAHDWRRPAELIFKRFLLEKPGALVCSYGPSRAEPLHTFNVSSLHNRRFCYCKVLAHS